MSRKTRLIAAALCALASLGSCLLYGNQVRAEAERVRLDALERYGGEVVTLVVATRTLEYGDIVDAGSVSTREWLADLAPAQAITRIEDVLGEQVTVPIAQGIPLTQLNFRDGTSGLDVPAGFVALSLPLTDKLGLSRNISAGTRVVAYSVGSHGTVMLTAHALVLASPVETTSFSQAQSLSLAVRPEDVSAVLGAGARGDLRLVVPADDVDLDDTDQAAPAHVDATAEDTQDASARDAAGKDTPDAGEDAASVASGKPTSGSKAVEKSSATPSEQTETEEGEE